MTFFLLQTCVQRNTIQERRDYTEHMKIILLGLILKVRGSDHMKGSGEATRGNKGLRNQPKFSHREKLT